MKVSIGTNIKDGPWGGGNLFAVNLKSYLLNNGHEVVHDLEDDDLDIILITEPRKTSESSAFTHIQVQNYLRFQNSNALVVHRINECDERKGTNFVNKYLIEANKVADQTVFVSRWLKDLYIRQGMNQLRKTVILAGADKKIFNTDNKSVWKEDQKIKLITHHWGANKNKGFDVYEKIDDLMGTEKWKEKTEFTYVGNLPANFNFRNARHITPLSGEKLAKEIKKNHIYITASINEPSGNHHIEGSQCGLPVMFIESGGVTEYCKDYGTSYTLQTLESKLEFVLENYNSLSSKISLYPNNSDRMAEEFMDLFKNMLKQKDTILNSRSISQSTSLENITYQIKKSLLKFLKY